MMGRREFLSTFTTASHTKSRTSSESTSSIPWVWWGGQCSKIIWFIYVYRRSPQQRHRCDYVFLWLPIKGFRVALDLFLCVMIWTVGIPHYSCIYVLQNLGIPQSIKWQLPFTVLALAFCSTFVYLINSQNNTSAPRLYLSLTLWYHK